MTTLELFVNVCRGRDSNKFYHLSSLGLEWFVVDIQSGRCVASGDCALLRYVTITLILSLPSLWVLDHALIMLQKRLLCYNNPSIASNQTIVHSSFLIRTDPMLPYDDSES